MARPSKPCEIIKMEKKSHRTKAELAARANNEKELLSNTPMKERPEVKEKQSADKEYKRINKILKKIDKNDALYEPIINRYCMIQAECQDLEERREEFYELIHSLKNDLDEQMDNDKYSAEERMELRFDYTRELAKMMNSMMACDKQIQAKRKMLLEIEKECVMTIASSLRSIPKKQESKTNALMEILGGSG